MSDPELEASRPKRMQELMAQHGMGNQQNPEQQKAQDDAKREAEERRQMMPGQILSAEARERHLSTKKCVPCSTKDLRPMTEQAANELIPQVEGWNLINEDGKLKLNRSWKVKSFTKGLELFKLVADVAEAEGHHPDLHLVGWNNVTIEIWTHAVGGLTENDFILAAKINVLHLQQFLRKKVAS